MNTPSAPCVSGLVHHCWYSPTGRRQCLFLFFGINIKYICYSPCFAIEMVLQSLAVLFLLTSQIFAHFYEADGRRTEKGNNVLNLMFKGSNLQRSEHISCRKQSWNLLVLHPEFLLDTKLPYCSMMQFKCDLVLHPEQVTPCSKALCREKQQEAI